MCQNLDWQGGGLYNQNKYVPWILKKELKDFFEITNIRIKQHSSIRMLTCTL